MFMLPALGAVGCCCCFASAMASRHAKSAWRFMRVPHALRLAVAASCLPVVGGASAPPLGLLPACRRLLGLISPVVESPPSRLMPAALFHAIIMSAERHYCAVNAADAPYIYLAFAGHYAIRRFCLLTRRRRCRFHYPNAMPATSAMSIYLIPVHYALAATPAANIIAYCSRPPFCRDAAHYHFIITVRAEAAAIEPINLPLIIWFAQPPYSSLCRPACFIIVPPTSAERRPPLRLLPPLNIIDR